MKNQMQILTHTKGENYGVIYRMKERVFVVVDEDGKLIENGEFEIGNKAVDFAFDEYEKNGEKRVRRLYTKIKDFTVIEVLDENGKTQHYFVGDNQEEKLSNKTFDIASKAIEHGHELTESKGLLND